MRIIFITIILCLSINAQAQNKKNEIQIGVPGAYFFGNSFYRIHSLKSVPIPTYIKYGRSITNNISISVDYYFYWLGGDQNKIDGIYRGLTLSRHFDVVNVLLNYSIYNTNFFRLSSFLGLSKRFSGGELFHVRYTYANGIPWEEILGYRAYNDFGISFGTEVKYKFYKRFSFGLEINYTRYFTQVSPNQLSTAMFLGYEF